MIDPGPDELFDQIERAFPPGPFLDRRLGRGLAFQALYEMDLAHHQPSQVLDRLTRQFVDARAAAYPAELVRDARDYALHLVDGFLANRPAIDDVIQQRAPLWPLAQMSAVDRNVLRLGLYESLYGNATVPLRTAINEAVELAKLFGSETSAKFVNGVLGRAVEANASGEASSPATPAHDSGGGALPAAQTQAPGARDGSDSPATSAASGERGLHDGHER
jgi:transcription antitermination protein NusB